MISCSCKLTNTDLEHGIQSIARAARHASRQLAKLSNAQRNRALRAVAAQIRAGVGDVISANAEDLAAAERNGLSAAMVDRLRLDEARLEKVAAAVEEVADLPDLLGSVVSETVRPNGLLVQRVRIPLGVVGIVYESRPNVTSDAAALCLKAGNACVLRGGSEAFRSNQALGKRIAAGIEQAGLPPACVQVVPSTDRDAVKLLLQQADDIDVIIPRGGEGLIRFVTETSRIPVIKHYKGVCHVFIDRAADRDMALEVSLNAKAQRVGVCNAAETILVHRDAANEIVPALCRRLAEAGVEIRGDERVRELGGSAVVAATEDDWHAEYLALIVAMRVVDDLEQAIEHIERYGSDHTEAIITADETAAERFLRECNSSTVVVNASTRFADGGELGLGAEIGVSTTKLHAYGPMGAEGLTTTKFVVRGTGQVRE